MPLSQSLQTTSHLAKMHQSVVVEFLSILIGRNDLSLKVTVDLSKYAAAPSSERQGLVARRPGGRLRLPHDRGMVGPSGRVDRGRAADAGGRPIPPAGRSASSTGLRRRG